MKLYCVKCRMKRESESTKRIKKGKRHFLVGKCKTCGTLMHQITS